MEFEIIYRCGLSADLYGFEGKEKVEFDVVWDAPVSNPNDPKLWHRQKESLLSEIECLISKGVIPFVAVFTPEGKSRPLSEQEFHNAMDKRFRTAIVNGEPCYQGVRLKNKSEGSEK